MRAGWRIVEVVVRRRHILRGEVNHPWLHPIALAAVNAMLPGPFYIGGFLVVDDGTHRYKTPVLPEIEAWIRAGGPISRERRIPVAIPPTLKMK